MCSFEIAKVSLHNGILKKLHVREGQYLEKGTLSSAGKSCQEGRTLILVLDACAGRANV